MEVMTLKEVIKGAPERWKNQYPQGKNGVYEKLIAAKPLSKKKVDTITGNESWTRLSCEECQEPVKKLVYMENSEYTFGICESCLNKALDMIQNA